MLSLGILGVGHLARYTVKGLRNAGDQRTVILSPRGQSTAQQLAQHSNCSIAESNQQVIDQADIILLAVRPQALPELLSGLTFKPEQVVVSVIAGLSLEQLKDYINLQTCTLIRALPSTSAEVNSGPIPIYPANKVVEQLFSTLGQAVPLNSESLFDIALSHACLHGWSYFLVQRLIDWSTAQGMDEKTARQMVAHSIGSAIDFAESQPELSYGEIGRSIATEGTFTETGQKRIHEHNGFDAWANAMTAIKNINNRSNNDCSTKRTKAEEKED